MVHALKDIWRVLARGGLLLDLRPRSMSLPVEVLGAEQVARAGHLEVSAESYADDRAADAALAAIKRDALFTRERRGAFSFFWYWDTPAEMKAYVEEKWTDTRLTEDVLAEAQRLAAKAGGHAKVRTRSRVHISRWRRLEP